MTAGAGQGDRRRDWPHPTALLLHPVTLVALGGMVVNDGWVRTRWPSPITGKVSDVAALVAYPGVVVTLWGIVVLGFGVASRALGARWRPARGMTPGVLLVAVLLPAALLTGINLSLVLRDAYLGLLGAVDLFGWGPFHYTMDPTDLWALPASGLPWWVGHRMIEGCDGGSAALS